ncbi:hypothetical protein NDI56_18690 [Haloarcula sp. S1CR25-12]|uniref:DUF7982 domain-containing protein n=1 Tax=Haloarcula saliterrae TaxID=2950534 RepID=A0ABU2FGQ1_9EURY|nr:hypothetical protein [Haloarcula sp. S1CR25-12]MDS0261433.1 hypothetical protein [Haloarcula sp. S1CR25-12]
MSTKGHATEATDDEHSREELRTQLELLAEENERLHESYVQAKTTQYRQTAIGLCLVGVLAVGGAVLLPNARDVLVALAGIGLFGAVLTYYLTPATFVSAEVGRDIYSVFAGNEAALVSELGLSDERVYVPVRNGDEVRLFVPQRWPYVLPEERELSGTIVVPEGDATRGLALEPSGGRLLTAVEDAVSGALATEPTTLTDQLSDAVVEQFEIAEHISKGTDTDDGTITVAVRGSVYGKPTQFDHPIASLLAVGLASGLGEPVSLDVNEATDNEDTFFVTCSWDE